MSIVFPEIISRISAYKITRSVNDHLNTAYHRAQLLSHQPTSYISGTIYIGEASSVTPEALKRDDIGLILINDCELDFSKLAGNAAEFPPETDLAGLLNEVLDAIDAKRKIQNSSAALLYSILEGKGLNDIIQIGAEITGKPVSLVDYTGKLLAVSNQQEISEIDLTPEGYLTQETYSIFRTHNFTKKVNESPVPVLLDIDHPVIPRMIVGRISIQDKIVGHLAVMENDQSFEEEDLEIVKVLIDVIAAEVQRNDYYLVMAGIHHEYFILDLLQEKHDNPTTIEDRVRSLQWDAYSDFFVVAINVPRKDERFFFVEYFRRRLGQIFPFSKSIYYQENVILVIYRDRDVQEIAARLDTILLENNLIAGISRQFSSIVDLKRHYEQAKQALSIGKLLKKQQRVFLYDDHYLYDLLTILNRHANLKDFCHPGIDTILSYDNENGTDYYATLFEYVMGSANLAQVAKTLHIHRNTLYNRIKKISEITELDLENGDNILKLLLSFKIMDLYNIESDQNNNG